MKRTEQLYVVLATQFLVTFSLMVLIPVMPIYLEQLSQSNSVSGLASAMALSAPAIGALLSAPLIGMFADKFPYKPVFMYSLTAYLVSLFTMAWSDSIALFIAARFLLGLSGVGLILTLYFSRELTLSQGRQLALQQQAIALACLTGPIVGGFSLQSVGMGTVLWGVAYLSLICLTISIFLLKSRASSYDHECHKDETEVAKKTPLSSQIWVWLIAGALSHAGAFALVVGFALFMTQNWQSVDTASQIGLIHALSWCGTFALAGYWGRKIELKLSAQSFALGALGCGLCIILIGIAPALWIIAVLRILQGCFFASQTQCFIAQINEMSSQAQQGKALGFAKSAQVVGQLLGPFAVALCFSYFGAESALWITAGFFIAAAALVAFLLWSLQVNFKVKTQ
ncbi:MFS transporter [Pseudoalteromonas sp. MTN2-4]|uniref:MFS transporter n=1 Tax=Pseudoalteromonas sp. MTN2-4 TaxID=3056555 RepID=UPI0036F3CBA5